MKQLFVVGNWKCNPKTLKRARKFLNGVNDHFERSEKVQVIICPPFVFIPKTVNNLNHQLNFDLGAQNCFWEKGGSFTGEVSVLMLKDLNCKYVIIGHSERRRLFKEEGEVIQKKISLCLEESLIPILCIDKISQLETGLKNIEDKSKVIIAFEPISAIGTGKPYNPEKAKKMNSEIQNTFKEKQIVLYGGSVNSSNVLDFVGEDKFNGVLVGGASLDSKEFVKIIETVKSLK